MICPNCSTEMDEVTVVGVSIDYCRNGCRGVFFDNFEIQKMDETHEGTEDPVLKEILAVPRADDARTHQLICPRCQIKMRTAQYSAGTGIHIDRCYSCNGVWLDAGELTAVRDNFRSAEVRKQIVDQITKEDPGIQGEMNRMEMERQSIEARSQAGRRSGILGLFRIFN